MRITCPNCTAHFEIPTELLGRKGRSLKCASCGHSWYQTPQVETIDLAEIMGEEYAARAIAEMGEVRPSTPQAQQPKPGAPVAPPPPGAVLPPGAVSMLRRPGAAAAPPGQPASQSWYAGGPQPPGAPRPGQPNVQAGRIGGGQPPPALPSGTPAWYNPEANNQRMAPPPPGAPSWYQPEAAVGQRPNQAPPGAPAWYQPEPAQQRMPGPAAGQPGWQQQPAPPPGYGGPAPLGAPLGMPQGPGGPQAAALSGQSMRGQAGAGAVGQGAVSWMQQPGVVQPPGIPNGAMQPFPGQQPGMMPPGMQQQMQQPGMQRPGQPAPAWQQQLPPGAPGGMPGGMPPGYNQPIPLPPGVAPGSPAAQQYQQAYQQQALQQQRQAQAAALSGQSLMQGAHVAAPGQGAVSWMQQPGVIIPPPQGARGPSLMGQAGAPPVGDGTQSWMPPPGQSGYVPGQSMQQQVPGAPGAAAMSQMGGAVAAPGQAARSMLDGSIQAPGAGAVSQMGGAVAAPGMASQSMLDGSIQQPGQAGQSQLGPNDGSAQAGVSQLQAPDGTAVPGTSIATPDGAGGAAVAGTGGAAVEGAAADGTGSSASTPNLVTTPSDPRTAITTMLEKDKQAAHVDFIRKEEEEKAAEAAAAEKSPLWSGAKEDEELVDPDADRPDFGTVAEEVEDEDDAEDEDGEGSTDEDDDEEASAKPPRKPIDPAYITFGIMALALIAIGTGIWYQRAPLLKLWPGFAAIYQKMGVAPKDPGEGLRLAQSGLRLVRIGGIETLVVKGYISNIGEKARGVPSIALQLVDATNIVIQDKITPPPSASLAPGESVDFELRMELPNMARAKNVLVNWVQ